MIKGSLVFLTLSNDDLPAEFNLFPLELLLFLLGFLDYYIIGFLFALNRFGGFYLYCL